MNPSFSIIIRVAEKIVFNNSNKSIQTEVSAKISLCTLLNTGEVRF